MSRLIELLDEEIQKRGYGARSGVDRAIGFRRGWWHNRVKADSLCVEHLVQVLDHLGLDPVKFLRRGLGREDELELDRPQGPVPELVVKAERRFEKKKEGLGVGLKWIETQDELRYSDPEKVIKAAELNVNEVELDLLPQFLGVVGSAWRMLFHLNSAQHAISAGIRMVKEYDQLTLGRLLQRLSYVSADHGNYREALALAERSGTLFLHIGDDGALGKALVDQGIWLLYSGQSTCAAATLKIALKLLPDDCARNRFCALQTLGLAFQSMGRLDSALRNLDLAREALPLDDEWNTLKLKWARGKILADLGNFKEAAAIFAELVDLYRDLHPAEAALTTCELVAIKLRQDLTEEAFQIALSMRMLVEPLRRNKIVSAAIAELLRSGREGLTLDLVKSVSQKLKEERQNLQGRRVLGTIDDQP